MENIKTVKKFKSFKTLKDICNVIYFSVSSIFSNINANPNKALSCRVSKSCNHAIIWLRKLFMNLRKFWTKNQNRKNWHQFCVFDPNWKLFLVSHVLCHFNACFSANFSISAILIAQQNLLLESLLSRPNAWRWCFQSQSIPCQERAGKGLTTMAHLKALLWKWVSFLGGFWFWVKRLLAKKNTFFVGQSFFLHTWRFAILELFMLDGVELLAVRLFLHSCCYRPHCQLNLSCSVYHNQNDKKNLMKT